MGFTIDIDTGGTFTDGFFARDGAFRTVKTPTTPHDLTVCFLECIEAGARAFGVAPADLLGGADVVRFSTTIGTNCLIERDGPRLGLLVTAGREELAPAAAADGKPPLVAADMVIGIREETAPDGTVRRAPDAAEALEAAQALIDRGARALVVALAGSDAGAANERAVRDAIRREYPRDYLGSVPVFLASDVSGRPGDRERVNAAVLNAYVHAKLARLLYGAGEDLRRRGHAGPLLIGHNTGAVARVAKTRALDTYNSGPAAGLLGARAIGALYGAGCVLAADMGGTSFDLGWVIDGEPGYRLRPEIDGFRTNLPMLAIRALGAGGGSIATVRDGRLRVGPESAGALPGPACFDLGGTEATVTDANLALGLLDPATFLGGRKRLSVERARAALATRVAGPLGAGVEEAAWCVRRTVEAGVVEEILRLRREAAGDAEPLMVLYGGAGPLHGCAIAEGSGIRRLVVTPFSAVFSAWASSRMDVGHLYSRRCDVALDAGADFSALDAALAGMRRRAAQDMRAEGFAADGLSWGLELIVEADGREARIPAPIDFHRDPRSLADAAARARRALGAPTGGATIRSVGLFARASVPHPELRRSVRAAGAAREAVTGTRAVHLESGRAALPVYDRSRLDFGHRLDGPAIVESDQTTILVEPGWSLAVDEYRNAVLERTERA